MTSDGRNMPPYITPQFISYMDSASTCSSSMFKIQEMIKHSYTYTYMRRLFFLRRSWKISQLCPLRKASRMAKIQAILHKAYRMGYTSKPDPLNPFPRPLPCDYQRGASSTWGKQNHDITWLLRQWRVYSLVRKSRSEMVIIHIAKSKRSTTLLLLLSQLFIMV